MTSSLKWIETNRLTIEHPNKSKLMKEEMYDLLNNSKVKDFVVHGTTREDIAKMSNSFVNHFDKHGFSVGPVYLNGTNKFIGRAGLFFNKINNEEIINLVAHLLPEYWGKGYGTEIVDALINYSFNDAKQEKILAWLDSSNKRSQNLMNKFKIIYDKTIELKGKTYLVHYIYKR